MSDQSPHQLAEQYVIGAVLADPSVLRAVQEQVLPRDFDDARRGAIYAGICRMVTERVPVNYLTVWDQLASWNVIGVDLEDLAGWAGDVPTATSGAYYAQMVRDAAVRRRAVAVGSRLVRDATEGDVGVAVAGALQSLVEVRDRDAAGVDGGKSLREVLAVPESEDAYDWVIPDLLERRDRLMLSGTEGHGKSTLLRQIAVLGAAGLHPFRFSRTDPIRALVVDAENSERQWRRATRRLADDAALRGARDPRDFLTLECLSKQTDITRPADQGAVHRLIDEHKPDLLLIGPLYRLVPRSIKDDDDAAPVLAALDSLRERDVAMLIEVHAGHARSSSGERDLRPRGSSALLGWPEFGLGLRRDKEQQAMAKSKYSLVRWRGDRDAREWPGRLTRHVSQIWPWEPAA